MQMTFLRCQFFSVVKLVQSISMVVVMFIILLLVPRGMSQFQEAYVMFHFTPSQVQLISNSG